MSTLLFCSRFSLDLPLLYIEVSVKLMLNESIAGVCGRLRALSCVCGCLRALSCVCVCMCVSVGVCGCLRVLSCVCGCLRV